MKTVYFVSSNAGKIEEVARHLEKLGITVIGECAEIPEIKSENLVDIAREKARFAASLIKRPVIAEDTGIYFEAYRNFPGPHSKFVFNSIGYEGIFRLLEGKSRGAFFRTVVAYCEPGKEPVIFDGVCRGEICNEVIGNIDERLPYDCIFIPEGETRAFSEMTKEEKAGYSHRAKALEKFAGWFNSG